MAVSPEALESAHPFGVSFGAASSAAPRHVYGFPVDVAVLAGEPIEQIFPPVREIKRDEGFALYEAGDLLLGRIGERFSGPDLEACTRRAYQRLLAAAQGKHLYRIWNYIARINAVTAGLENYRAFCRGRSVSFESAWGQDYKRLLPSGSAVGCDDDRLSVVFVAGKARPLHVENPEQVPAYEYPPEHGPRAPSFSRATLAEANGTQYLFVSGTAAIKGHATIAPGSLNDQIACTLDNLRLVSRAAGVGEGLGADGGWTRHFKIYLRRAEDLLAARGLLEGTLLRPDDRVTWLRADVCRAALNIEIEATLVKR